MNQEGVLKGHRAAADWPERWSVRRDRRGGVEVYMETPDSPSAEWHEVRDGGVYFPSYPDVDMSRNLSGGARRKLAGAVGGLTRVL